MWMAADLTMLRGHVCISWRSGKTFHPPTAKMVVGLTVALAVAPPCETLSHRPAARADPADTGPEASVLYLGFAPPRPPLILPFLPHLGQ